MATAVLIGAAAAMGGDLERLRLAAFLDQQERGLGVEHRHALDAVALDNGDRVDHGAADGKGFHHVLLGGALEIDLRMRRG